MVISYIVAVTYITTHVNVVLRGINSHMFVGHSNVSIWISICLFGVG